MKTKMTLNSQPTNKGRILIVDDTLINLHILTKTLEIAGYTVWGVTTGLLALDEVQLTLPDLILLDIIMPDIDGYEVCQQLKSDPITSNIPIIFISALDDVLDKVKAFKVGCVDYITKPFEVAEVLARVENQLTIKRLSRQLEEQNQQLQREIAERRKAEALAAAACENKFDFFANMSHALRTPLNAILGFSQMMINNNYISHQYRENIRIIHDSGQDLLALINEILELAKIDAGIIELEQNNFDLYRLLNTIEEMFEITAKRKKIDFQLMGFSDVPQYIRTDREKLRICLINIIDNAIKFTTYGSVTVRVSLGNKAETGNYLEFEVEDTGSGIEPGKIPQLFQAFVQKKAKIKSAEGAGLGLAIARKFIEMMGGELSINSILGRGSIFKFSY